jgi:hypothetical protein
MSILYDKCQIGAYMSGYMFCGRYASGTITAIFPSVGYMVENDGYMYLIVNKFGAGPKMSSNFLDFGANDYSCIDLTDETIFFWLKRGFRAKARLYGVEVIRRRGVDPMSETGLRLRVKVAPLHLLNSLLQRH